MARYVTSVRSPMAPDAAFAYLSDLRNFERWDPGVKSAQHVGGEPGVLGAEYEVVVTGSRLVYAITEFDPPHRFVAAAVTKRLTSRDVVTVAAEGDGSVCTYDATLTLNGAFRALEPVMALIFRRVGDRAARGLAEALEGVIVPTA